MSLQHHPAYQSPFPPPPAPVQSPTASSVDSQSTSREQHLHDSQSPISPQPNSDGGYRPGSAASSANNASQADGLTPPHNKPRQKRNKPTLSCKECVERKTKCDRTRPTCLACIKRSSKCEYSQVADVIAANPNKSQRQKAIQALKEQQAKDSRSPDKLSISTEPIDDEDRIMSDVAPSGLVSGTPIRSTYNPPLTLSTSRAPVALSSLARPNDTAVNIFGVGDEHPFANYWTCSGGLPEVIGVLPSKDQADILVEKYFETVDPIYPIIDRAQFYEEYEKFWRSSHNQRCQTDAAIIALHFVLYATATQYLELPAGEKGDVTKTAEFYISAAHQALRISSYMNHIKIPTVQAMILTFYFLVNDNHVSDAWTIVGITVRQACVLQLNRNPDLVCPDATEREKRLRCKLWYAIMYQDMAVCLFLKLAPIALISDTKPDHIRHNVEEDLAVYHKAMEAGFMMPYPPLPPEADQMDASFVRAMWSYTDYKRDAIVIPRALGTPLCKTVKHQQELLNGFKDLYQSFDYPFNSFEPSRFFERKDKRLGKQLVALSCNFFHAMMLIAIDENPDAGVYIDVTSALEVGHQALEAFFSMIQLVGNEVNGWLAYQHRAFEDAITMGNILADKQRIENYLETTQYTNAHSLLRTAKNDVENMIEVIKRSRGYFEWQPVQYRSLQALEEVHAKIDIV